MLSFLSPLFLIGAMAAAVPIVLHLLKREPEARIRFSAVRLLRTAPVEHTRRRHFNELLLLLLRVAALLLLALAFARPFFSSAGASPSATLTVVALDTSLSLSAPGQFDKARDRARQAIAGADTDLVALVTFADSAVVAARPSADRGLVQSAVDGAATGFGGTRYRAALNASAELFDGRSGTLVVVTDVQASGWKTGDDVRLPEGVRIDVADIGAPPPNFAVVGARRAGDRVIATVRNAAGEARDARIRLTVDGSPAGEALVPVEAGQTAEAALPVGAGRDASIEVDDSTGAKGDNAWHLVLETASRPAVLVVTSTGDLDRDAFYLRRAIAAPGRSGASYEVEGLATSRVAADGSPALDRFAAVALLSTRGLESRGREGLAAYVQAGGGMLMAFGPQVDPEVASGIFAGTLSMAAPEGSGARGGPVACARRHPSPRDRAVQRPGGRAGARDVPADRQHRCARLPPPRTIFDGRSRGCRLRARPRPCDRHSPPISRTRGMISRCTRRSCRSSRRSSATWAARGHGAAITWWATFRPVCPQCPASPR